VRAAAAGGAHGVAFGQAARGSAPADGDLILMPGRR
jgi:hypothetical protein